MAAFGVHYAFAEPPAFHASGAKPTCAVWAHLRSQLKYRPDEKGISRASLEAVDPKFAWALGALRD